MPRDLIMYVCRMCGHVYHAKDRKYKPTCSPECALMSSIDNAIHRTVIEGIPKQRAKEIIFNMLFT